MDWICENGDLEANQLNNLTVKGEFAELSENNGEGFLETPIVETEKFKEITPSWNSRTDKGSFVELFIRLRVEDNWTPYVSYGLWSTDGNNTGVGNYYKDEIIRATDDRIFVLNDKYGDAVQIKVVLKGKNPKLKLIAFSTDAGSEDTCQCSFDFPAGKRAQGCSCNMQPNISDNGTEVSRQKCGTGPGYKRDI